jgi:hypothetical protein
MPGGPSWMPCAPQRVEGLDDDDDDVSFKTYWKFQPV